MASKELELTPNVYIFAGVGALILGGLASFRPRRRSEHHRCWCCRRSRWRLARPVPLKNASGSGFRLFRIIFATPAIALLFRRCFSTPSSRSSFSSELARAFSELKLLNLAG